MLETLGMLLVGYAGYAGWPWLVAPIVGALAGMWNIFSRGRKTGVDFGSPDDRLAKQFVSAAPLTMLLSAGLFTGIYFVMDWLVG